MQIWYWPSFKAVAKQIGLFLIKFNIKIKVLFETVIMFIFIVKFIVFKTQTLLVHAISAQFINFVLLLTSALSYRNLIIKNVKVLDINIDLQRHSHGFFSACTAPVSSGRRTTAPFYICRRTISLPREPVNICLWSRDISTTGVRH